MNLTPLIKPVGTLEVLSISGKFIVVRLANGSQRTLVVGDKVEFTDRIGIVTPRCDCDSCREPSNTIIGLLMSVGFVPERATEAVH